MPIESSFNHDYFTSGCGEDYHKREEWIGFFREIAANIISSLHPRNVLDVGCAFGYLVEALREQGVDAWGIDVSAYAVGQASESIKPFVYMQSAAKPLPETFPQQFDLIVSIEMLEHVFEEDAMDILNNLSKYTDNFLISASCSDFNELTHFNVQPPAYWVEKFAKQGFFEDVLYDGSYITPQTILVKKQPGLEKSRIAYGYKHVWWYTVKEVESLKDQLQKLQEMRKDLEGKLDNKQCNIQELEEILQKEVQDKKDSTEKYQCSLNDLYKELDEERNLRDRHETQFENLKTIIDDYKSNITEAEAEINRMQGCLTVAEQNLAMMENAFFWKITYPIRTLSDILKRIPLFRSFIINMKGMRNSSKQNHVAIADGEGAMENTLVQRQELDRLLEEFFMRPPVQKHSESIDIIICVHNAYDDVKRCIESVYEYTSEPYNIIIVDDGSSEQTYKYLVEMEKLCPNITRIRNEQGHGYCYAANMGMKESRAQYMILLNSDTIVTEGWVDKLIACAKSDPAIGIVGPLSNTASWQSIPQIFDVQGDWCHNVLPEGVTIESFGKMIEKTSSRIYPQVPLLNGFCMLITRQTVEKIGYFDEENFGPGFGEEDDFNLRAGKAGVKLAVADDTYIYHAQSKSYTDEKRRLLCESAGKKLRAKHGDALLDESVHIVHKNYVFEGIRMRAEQLVDSDKMISSGLEKFEGKRLLIILPLCEAGGGGNVVLQEASAMQQMGVDVWLFNLEEHKKYFQNSYPNLEFPVIYEDSLKEIRKYAKDFDAICCTLFTGVQYCDFSDMQHPPRVVYYIQDFEPFFFEKGSDEYRLALKSYTASDSLIRITKTNWNARQVLENCGVSCTVIGPSINIDLFRPRRMFHNVDCVKICAMVRPNSPRRAPEATLRILRKIKMQYQDRIEIIFFGCSDIEITALEASKDFEFKNYGPLTPQQMSALLSQVDIFADFSIFQAMGLTALEAMACGCATIVPENGGTDAYALHEENCLVVDTSKYDQCCAAVERLVEDVYLREQLAQRAIFDAGSYSPEKCAASFLNSVFLVEDN